MFSKIKILLHIIAVFGVVLTLGNSLNWFQEKSYLEVYDGLTHEPYRMEITHSGVQKFLNDFYDPQKANEAIRKAKIIGIKSNWVAIGDNKPMSGTVHLWLEDNKQSTAIITFDELSDWVKKTPLYN